MKVTIDSANQRLQSYSGTVAEQDYLHAVITTDDGVMALLSGRGGVVGGSTTAPPTNPAPSFTVAPSATPTAATVGQPVALSLGTVANGTATGVLMQGTTNRTSEISNGSWTPTVAGGWTWAVTATGAGGTTAAPVVSGTAASAGSAPSFTAAASISPASGPVGTVFTINNGAVSGSPTPTVTRTLTQAGVDVTSQISGSQFTSTAAGALSLTVTASNGVSPAATSTASATVSAASTATGLLSGTTMPSQPQAQPDNLVPQPAGEFNSASGWSTHTGLTIDTANGLAVWDGSSTTQQAQAITLTSPAVIGHEYGLLTSVTSRTAGQLSFGLGTPGAVSATGSITVARARSGRVTATGASTTARLTVGASSAMSIDYLRVYDLTVLMQKKWRIVFVYSQSNWVGQEAADANSIIFAPESRAIVIPGSANTTFGAELDGTGIGRPMPVIDPIQHQTGNTGGGPGGAFCKAFANGLLNDEVLVYVATGYAGGGRMGSDGAAVSGVWNRQAGGIAWVKMEQTLDALVAGAPVGSTVAGSIFCQGETDRGVSSAAAHAAAIRGDYVYLRGKYGNFPIVVMEIGTVRSAGNNTDLMCIEQAKLDSNSGDALALPRCRYFTRPANAVLRSDAIHFDQTTCEYRGGQQAAPGLLALNYGIAA